ncbi:hypothetical protein DFJ74DRAFT_769957 [Hyaloraphidium curvatum]|nr:hypothetical protein DFJ74DRAFT_769957 [Hyaloraphidium curvatum]
MASTAVHLARRLYIDGIGNGPVNQTLEVSNTTLEFSVVFTEQTRAKLASQAGFVATYFTPDFSAPGVAIRNGLVRGRVLADNQPLTAQEVWNSFWPAIIAAAVLVLVAGIFIPISIYMCAKIHPALAKGFVERPRGFYKPFSFKRLWFPILVILVTVGCAIWSLIMLFHGNYAFTQNLNNVKSAGADLFLLTGAKLLGIGPLGGLIVEDMNATVRTTLLALVNTINPSNIVVGIEPNVAALGAALNASSQDLANLANNATRLDTASKASDAAYPPLRSGASSFVTSAGNALNSPNPFPTNNAAGATYQLSPALALPNPPTQAVSPQPLGVDAAQKLVGFVGTGADSARTAVDAAAAEVAKYNATALTIKINQALSSAVDRATAVIAPALQDVLNQINAIYQQDIVPIAGSIDNVARQFIDVVDFLLKIDLARNILTYILAGFGAVALIVVVVAMLARSPRWVGHCTLAALALGIISLIVGALYLSIGVVLGATCQALEQENFDNLLPTINQIAGTNITPAMVNSLLLARRQCAAGVGGFKVAAEVVRALVAAGVIRSDFDEAAVQRLEAAVDRLRAIGNGTVQVDVQTALNSVAAEIPSALNRGLDVAEAALGKALDEAGTLLDQVTKPLIASAQRNPYSPALQSAVADLARLALPGGTAGRAASTDPARVAEAASLLQAAGAGLNSTWTALDTTQGAAVRSANADVLTYATGSDASLEAARADLGVSVAATIALANATARLTLREVQNFTTYGLPPIESAVRAFFTGTAEVIEALAACQSIIEDTFVIQNAVCIGVSRATDELWLGAVIQGFVWTAGAILMLYAVKKVWATDSGWRWKGRKEPMSSFEAEKYVLSGQQMAKNVEAAPTGADWSQFTEPQGGYANGASPAGASPASYTPGSPGQPGVTMLTSPDAAVPPEVAEVERKF